MNALPAPAQISALFSRESFWQACLDVEAAMALEQGHLGMIPADAAGEITARAQLDVIGADALAADIERTQATIVSLVRLLSAACSDEAAGYVHWGGTTQNIMQTARTVQMKKAHQALMQRFANALDALCDLAEQSCEMLAVSRTNRRQALPVTFGYKLAIAIEELLRHDERFRQIAPRVFTSQMGGAVGAMHAWGEAGPALNVAVSRRLGLEPLHIPARSALDHIAEYVFQLSLCATSIGRIVNELYLLMGDEYSEVAEVLGADVIGSSTMPHKVNPKYSGRILSQATRLRSHVSVVFEAIQPSNESDHATNLLLYSSMGDSVVLAYELLCNYEALLPAIRLFPENMRRNVELSGGLIVAENVMMTLAPVIGRTYAHDRVHHCAAQASVRGIPFIDVLMADPEIARAVTRETLSRALEPDAYTGLSVPLTRESIEMGRLAVTRLREG